MQNDSYLVLHLTEEIFLFNPTTVQFHWKVSVKFTEILNKSHNWKKCSNKEVTKLLATAMLVFGVGLPMPPPASLWFSRRLRQG